MKDQGRRVSGDVSYRNRRIPFWARSTVLHPAPPLGANDAQPDNERPEARAKI